MRAVLEPTNKKLFLWLDVMAMMRPWINIALILWLCDLTALVYGCGDGERPRDLIEQILDSDYVVYGRVVERVSAGRSTPGLYEAVMELGCTLKGATLPSTIRVLAGNLLYTPNLIQE